MNSVAELAPMMGSLQLHVEELKQVIWQKDETIRILEDELRDKNKTIEGLKSQLDKYQSVFFLQQQVVPVVVAPANAVVGPAVTNASGSGTNAAAAPPLSPNKRSPRRQRIMGISAEAHRQDAEGTALEFIRHYPKPTRYV